MSEALVYLAVEGDVDEAVLRRVLDQAGATPIAVYGKFGKDHLTNKLPAYNAAARYWPWVVVRDLNSDAPCASALVAQFALSVRRCSNKELVHAQLLVFPE